MIPDKDRNVVVVGGGFAGVEMARCLERALDPSWDVFLLTPSNVLTYNPLLPEVVGGALLPGHVAAPIRLMLRRARIRMVGVHAIDLERREVHYRGVLDGTVAYEHLVLATGMSANLDAVVGMAEHAVPLKTLGDALHLRNLLLRRLEEATLTRDAARRRELMSFIVVGGGFSGVETAGEIRDFVKSSARYYRNVDVAELRVILLQGGKRLLPEISPELARYAQRKLAQRGVTVRTDARVSRVCAHGVVLVDGSVIRGATIVSTIGVAAHTFVAQSGLPIVRGRLDTNADMRVRGQERVWAVGDCARVVNAYDDSLSPSSAQFAVRQARQAAANLQAAIAGRDTRAFNYQPVGQIAGIGHRRAVAEIRSLRIHGFSAWLLWRAIYLLKIPTLTARVRVYLEWTWSMFFPRDPGYLDFRRTNDPSTRGDANET